MIDTRVELIGALREAAEIEHGLMIQYLFPALTMKKRLDEGLTGPQQRSAREWEAIILGVAVEEMGHLGTVCNLLAAVGAGPHFGRPNFPQEVGYYDSDGWSMDVAVAGDNVLLADRGGGLLILRYTPGEPTPTPTATSTPTATASPTATPTETLTPTATATRPAFRERGYLPLLLAG